MQTLLYADMFDFPLSEKELWVRLIAYKGTEEFFRRSLQACPHIQRYDHYYVLTGRASLVAERKKRGRWSRQKLLRARNIARMLRRIPTILLCGVSGSVAAENARDDEDIDVFIITSRHTVWITRLCVLLLMLFFGSLRRGNTKTVRNHFCFNMFLDEDHLLLPKQEQDLFAAYEIIQMHPLYEKKNTYHRFLQKNTWVSRFLPHALPWLQRRMAKQTEIPSTIFLQTEKWFLCVCRFFEKWAQSVQLRYMQRKTSTEIIHDGYVRFHPHDRRAQILAAFHKRVKGLDKMHSPR